jgi:hypothetical protein
LRPVRRYANRAWFQHEVIVIGLKSASPTQVLYHDGFLSIGQHRPQTSIIRKTPVSDVRIKQSQVAVMVLVYCKLTEYSYQGRRVEPPCA